ncbi:MAG: tetratricopeptide repeat protein [Syntrophobacteria bacterium]
MPTRENIRVDTSLFTKLDIFVCLLLFIATLAVYWQVGNYEFVNFDDDKYIIENFHVQKGLTRDSVIWAFTATHVSNWHPLTWLSHMLDFQLYGLNPSGHHLTNVFFHLVNTLLLFLVLKLMTGALWRSGLVAALFAVHPLHVESVVWVAERKDVLSTLFWMLTLWAYLGYTKRPGVKRYLVILLAFALGLMAKPMLVTLPFVLLLLDYWPLKRIELGQSAIGLPAASQPSTIANKPGAQAFRLLLEKTPMFVLAAVSSVVTFIVQKSGGAVGALETYPFKIRMANALLSYVIYLKKMIWPQNLAVFYPHPGQSLPMWQAAGAGLLLVVVSIAVIRAGRRYPYLPVGWLWYVGTLVPVIGLVQVGDQAMADRYTYVSLIGLFIVVAWGVPDVARSWRYGKSALALATGSLLVALMVSTSLQLKHWKNSLTLFDHALSVTDRNYLAHTNFGNALAELGRVDEALFHFTEAVKIRPSFSKAYNNLGNALARQGRDEEAIFHLTRALELEPDFPRAHNNLGNLFERQRKIEEAVFHYSMALELKPDFAEAYFNLGNLQARQGKMDQAISHFSSALQIKPDFAEAHNSLGVVLAYTGRLEEAIAHFTEALQIEPGFVRARTNLSTALRQAGKSNLIPGTGGEPEN